MHLMGCFPDREELPRIGLPWASPFPLGKTVVTNICSPEALGDVIRHARQSRGWTQATLAMLADVGVRFIVDLERGKPTAQIGKAMRVLRSLRIEIELVVPRE
jgi:y4mF family transcriptional regulator